ncbi:MAG: amidase family protein [Thaumarchaeota archaeon]|nr:amidase family protein [Nitrososphaerota archaeon]
MTSKNIKMLAAKVPNREKIIELSRREYIHLESDELNGIEDLFGQLISAANTVGILTQKMSRSKDPARESGYKPDQKEDPYNAFIRKISIRGSGHGLLTGKKIGIKDNIAVRGIPMTNASDLSKDFVPDYDATIVTRLLEAGGEIVGKMNLDNYSFSGTSETSIFGPVHNPLNPEYSPGGSSSGSGAAVASGQVDIAIGVDQGGSARVPASCCGVVAIKPTQGVVPTYGLTYMDHSFDHISPIAHTVVDAATTLSVIAGPDKNDPQWSRSTLSAPVDYRKEIETPIPESFRIGFVTESVTWEATDPEIKECFQAALGRLRTLGAKISEVSIPLFKESGSIWITIVVQSTHAMFDSCGGGYWNGGQYSPEWNEHIGRARKERADLYPPLLKGSMLIGRYLREEYYSIFHSMAQNLRNKLRDDVDAALEQVDILATPTMIVKPPKLKEKITFSESLNRGVLLLNNTEGFNLTGHPAITIPCGMRGGLPVGLQLIGKRLDEAMLFRIARLFERRFNWREL